LAKHGFERKLKDRLKGLDPEAKDQKAFAKEAEEIVKYMKTLSPSGVELEFLSLASFDFENKDDKDK